MVELNKIYNEECLEGMKRIDDKSIDCIICDLPYEVLHKNNPNAQWDRVIPFKLQWDQYLRIAKDNAAIVLFCQGMFTANLMMSNPDMWRYNMVWEKGRVTGFLNANRMPMRSHEDIAVFYRRQPTYNPKFRDGDSHPQGMGEHKCTNQCYGEVNDNRFNDGNAYDYDKGSMKTVHSNGKCFPTSVLHFKKEHSKDTFHPTQKPVDLVRWLIRTYTNENETVLDNCMGSGTTAIAAIREKRNFIGFELNEEYCNKANERVDNELKQTKLW